MKKLKNRSWAAVSLAWSLFGAELLVLIPPIGAQGASTWKAEMLIFSGRPNPVFELTASELAHVTQIVSNAKIVPQAKEAEKVFPPILGYQGMRIRELSAEGRLEFEIRVRGRDILEQRGQVRTWRTAPDYAVEQYVFDLALRKGVIDESTYHGIARRMEKARTAKP